MSPLRCLIFAALLTSAYAFAQRKVRTEQRECKKCPYAYRCSPYYSDELIWAIVDGTCKVFANGCMSGSFNCGRINDCKSGICKTNKEECQKCCAFDCEHAKQESHYGYIYALSKDGSSAGAEYCKNFTSECAANRWSCQTETPLASVSPGTCS